MKTSQLRRNIVLKKKIKIDIILIVISLILFFISMLGFVVNACTAQNITLAWILLIMILISCVLFVVGVVLFLINNKEKIKKYLKEII